MSDTAPATGIKNETEIEVMTKLEKIQANLVDVGREKGELEAKLAGMAEGSPEDMADTIGKIAIKERVLAALALSLTSAEAEERAAAEVAETERRKQEGVDRLTRIAEALQAAQKAADGVLKASPVKLADSLKKYDLAESELIQAAADAGGRIAPLPLREWLAVLSLNGGCPELRHPAIHCHGQLVTHATDWRPKAADLPSGVLAVAVLKAAGAIAANYGLSEVPDVIGPDREFLSDYAATRGVVKAEHAEKQRAAAEQAAEKQEAATRADALAYYKTMPVALLQKWRSDFVKSHHGNLKALKDYDARKLGYVYGALRQLAPVIADVLLEVDTTHGFTYGGGFDGLDLRVIGDNLDTVAEYYGPMLRREGGLAIDYAGCPPFGEGVTEGFMDDRQRYPTVGIAAAVRIHKEATTIKFC